MSRHVCHAAAWGTQRVRAHLRPAACVLQPEGIVSVCVTYIHMCVCARVCVCVCHHAVPDRVVPVHYDLFLDVRLQTLYDPKLPADTNRVEGTVKTRIRVMQATHCVVLHADPTVMQVRIHCSASQSVASVKLVQARNGARDAQSKHV